MILDQAYKDHSGVSNSMIKSFISKGPKIFFDEYIDPLRPESREKSTESTDIGDLVDCLITGSDELFNATYYISGDVKISGDFKAIIDKTWQDELSMLLKAGISFKEALTRDNLRDIRCAITTCIANCRTHASLEDETKVGYRNNYGDAALEKYIVENATSYYSDLGTANGRKIIDQQLYNIAISKKEELLTDMHTASIFNDKKEVEVHNQYMVTAMIEGIECKILLDRCEINHTSKIIYPFDVKTAMSSQQFIINYKQFNYDKQGSFYTAVLAAAFPGYTIAPFKFVTCFTKTTEKPIIYEMSDNDLYVAMVGDKLKMGWKPALKLIKWHMENAMWEYPAEMYKEQKVILDTYANNSEAPSSGWSDTDDVF